MADEDVIAGAGEQVPVEDDQAQATGADGAEADIQPDGAGDESTLDSGAVLDPDETESEPESLETFLARNEAARAEHERILRERENAGSQRREAQLKLEAGRKENTIQSVRRWLSESGDQPDEQRGAYLYELAAANAAHEIATALPEAILRSYQLPAEVREKAIEARERGDWDGYVQSYVEGAVNAVLETKVAEREKAIKAEYDKKYAAEVKALRAENAPKRDGALPTPAGSAAPTKRIDSTTYRTASREQREIWRKDGGYTLVSEAGVEVAIA